MKSVRTMAAASVTLLAGAVACDRQVETGASRLQPTEPSFAVVVNDYARYTPRQNANGVYLLDRLCDVFSGDPEFVAPEIRQKYAHQTVGVGGIISAGAVSARSDSLRLLRRLPLLLLPEHAAQHLPHHRLRELLHELVL